MAFEEREIRVSRIGGEARPTAEGTDEASVRELIRNLADNSANLVRQEVNLAKLEVKETANALMRDVAKLGIALGFAAAGGLALTAFLILVIGDLLDGAYWAGALIVGGLFVLIGGVLAIRAINDLKKRDMKPDETLRTLREDKRWAQREAQEFKRELRA